MAKKINEDSMSALFNGLTSGSEASSHMDDGTGQLVEKEPKMENSKHTKSSTQAKEQICTLVETEVMSKVRVIAEKEGISIASMVNLGLKVVLENYEKNHGKVKGRTYRKGNIDEVFDI